MAERLAIESKTLSAKAQVPTRGMRMEQVEKRFGVPESKLPAVGDPPITRWRYSSYTVYFERDRVIHSVVRR